MKLHENKEIFQELITATSNHFNIRKSLIEKDYFIVLILKEASSSIPGLVFKGGTSLSKCHKIIDRFSEDVDLTLNVEHSSQTFKRGAIRKLIDICNKYPLELTNKEQIRKHTHGVYNLYLIKYPFEQNDDLIKPNIFVEMVNILKCYPSEQSEINSYIGEYLSIIGRFDIIDEYELKPFKINVQSLNRTLVDKVFAICDYCLRNEVIRNSRHIYDIARLLEKVPLNDELAVLIHQVRNDRKKNKKCVSAQDGVSVNQILKEIIKSEFYKNDYNNVTKNLLFKPYDYETAIDSLQTLINSGLFEL